MIYEFNGIKPVIHQTAYIHPQAAVIGNVQIGKHVYVGPGAALRGDFGAIIIEDNCNVQENCTIHMFPGATVLLKKMVHMGHGCIVHGATVEENVLIGMNSVIMDNVVIGRESIIGALCFVKAEEKIPPRSLVVGNPAKIIKQVTDEMLAWKTKGTEIYMEFPADCYRSLKPCKPLRHPQEENEQLPMQEYQPWKVAREQGIYQKENNEQ